jgi:hypothetical protein
MNDPKVCPLLKTMAVIEQKIKEILWVVAHPINGCR